MKIVARLTASMTNTATTTTDIMRTRSGLSSVLPLPGVLPSIPLSVDAVIGSQTVKDIICHNTFIK